MSNDDDNIRHFTPSKPEVFHDKLVNGLAINRSSEALFRQLVEPILNTGIRVELIPPTSIRATADVRCAVKYPDGKPLAFLGINKELGEYTGTIILPSQADGGALSCDTRIITFDVKALANNEGFLKHVQSTLEQTDATALQASGIVLGYSRLAQQLTVAASPKRSSFAGTPPRENLTTAQLKDMARLFAVNPPEAYLWLENASKDAEPAKIREVIMPAGSIPPESRIGERSNITQLHPRDKGPGKT